jgi:hypothetical protein
MTPKKFAFLHALESPQYARYRGVYSRHALHYKVMDNPLTYFEQAIVGILKGWECYAEAYDDAYRRDILESGLHHHWTALGEALLGLLNGELHDLNKDALSRSIHRTLSRSEEEDKLSDWLPATFLNGDPQSSELISSCRAQAITDGVLVDVTEIARRVGFRLPVALTQTLWEDIHAVPERLRNEVTPEWRLWWVLSEARRAFKHLTSPSFSSLYRLSESLSEEGEYEVKVVFGPGDRGEPVLTLMQASEE